MTTNTNANHSSLSLSLSLSLGHAGMGHPKVYINLDKPEINVCGYCGKRFVADSQKHHFPNEKFVENNL